MKILKHIKDYKNIIVLIICVLFLTIAFETSQQLFYINRFNLTDDASFLSLLKSQAYRWLIWLLLSGIIFWYIKSKNTKLNFSVSDVFRYSSLILVLVSLNIIIISTSQLITNGDSFSLKIFINEYIQFYVYQKAPMYILGYIAITVIMHLYFANTQLQIKVQKLSELKTTNALLYKKLNTHIDEKATILNIKIGNKRKIIPTADVLWIEADDYCVKVHTITNGSYTMRSSLKALEEKLSAKFLRVHRKAIVNMSFAKELHMSGSPNLILNSGTQIPVSKSNLKTVKDFLN